MAFASAEERAASGKLVTTLDTATEQRNRYSLSDADVAELARYALVIEQHYGRPMDIEWGKDGVDGKLYILQARPETVMSQRAAARPSSAMRLKGSGTVLVEGPRDRPEDRHRPGPDRREHRRHGPGPGRRRPRHRHDRSRTGSR